MNTHFFLSKQNLLFLFFIVVLTSCSSDSGRPVKVLVSASKILPEYTTTFYGPEVPGYYFLSTYKIGSYGDTSQTYQLILDGKGEPVYFRKTGLCFDFKLQPNGLISFFEKDRFYLMDSTFQLVDSVTCANGIETDLHDFQVLPSGNYLTLGAETIVQDLSPFRLFNSGKLSGSSRARVKACVIQELDKNRNVVFEWHAKDHFKFDEVNPFYLNDTLNVNWTHANAIDKDSAGNYLLTVRNFDEVVKIDGKSGSLLWRLGGKKNQFIFLNDPLPLLGLHDCRFMDSGKISLFDNGHSDASSRHLSRAVIYSLNESKKTVELVHEYKTDAYCKARGNFHNSRNGGLLINFGEVENENVTFCMIDENGKRLMDLKFKDGLGSYRAFFYKTLPWKINHQKTTLK